MNKQFGLKALLISSPLLVTNAFANEQPAAEDLVGKFYGGAHLLYIDTDNDRIEITDTTKANDPFATVDHAGGFGAEVGYRFTESTEFRFTYSQINIEKLHSFFDKPYAAKVDTLFFPTEQNFYVIGGLGYLDVGQEELSFNIGAGYRHYLSDRTAVYAEAKGHVQFSGYTNEQVGHYTDKTAQLGFIYFFGDGAKASPAKAEKTAYAAAGATAVASVDSDNDGVPDDKDLCPNTPITDKVDASGCSIYVKETSKKELVVKFDNNKAIVKDAFLPAIERMAGFLNEFPDVSLVIEGHTSKVGPAAFNKKLSQQRAEAIVDVLVNKFDIDSNRLTAVGFGEERLIDLNNDAPNRRIEAKVEGTKEVPVRR